MNEKLIKQPELLEHYQSKFIQTITFIARTFPYGFRKIAKGKATPRARFEAIAVGTLLAIQQKPELLQMPSPNVEDWLISENFTRVTGSDGANAVARLRERTGFVRDCLLRV